MTSPPARSSSGHKRKASNEPVPTQKRPRTSHSPSQSRTTAKPHVSPAKVQVTPRDPTPPPRSPPRQRKRPGAGARITPAQVEAAKKAKDERDAQLQAQNAQRNGVQNIVTQHYNTVPERGREWRKTDSKIKGLRSFNNWVKSVLIRKCTPQVREGVKVLDIGCGKGGDLQKWQNQPGIELYVGLDPAEVSVNQARSRYEDMRRRSRRRLFHAEFITRDCFGTSIGDIPILRNVGFDADPNSRWGGGGFDLVTMMFCMHYAFESEEKARLMLSNVAGALKKGGKLIGVIPNSDIISDKVVEHHAKHKPAGASNSGPFEDDDDEWDPEKSLDVPDGEAPKKEEPAKEEPAVESVAWGNSIYRVKFPGKTPADGVFYPPYAWKYFYFLEEAVEEVPEYVVPWEAFRGLAEDYNLELEYRKPFNEIWEEEKDDRDHGPLSERMGVRGRDGSLRVSKEEMDAAAFYHAFCFYKV